AVPIGRPIANTQAYVLDQLQRPLVAGARGELYLGGANISRGYLGDPRLTAEKFIPDPFSFVPGARLYRTGDLARWRHDGQIEFLGRVDQQVKIRGHRIEPAEVETALLQHEAVRDAVVVAREEANGERRLLAYVVADRDPLTRRVSRAKAPSRKETLRKGGSALRLGAFARETSPSSEDRRRDPEYFLCKAELRSFLTDLLPAHMIPASFTLLEALPRLPGSKIDRRALPQPDLSCADGSFVAPRTSVERVLCELWAEVLKLERIGIHDNFFELGGDSILSIQVAARARLAGLQLSPTQIFQHPTPAQLAAVTQISRASHAVPESTTGNVPLTPIQHWFFEQHFPFPDYWNMALMLKARERLDPGLLEQAFAHLVHHHDALRLRFNASGAPRQFIADGDPGANGNILHVVNLSDVVENEQQSFLETIADETQAQLDVAKGVVLRAVLFELGEGQPPRLLIVIHHLVVDGVSWRILLEDLGRTYRQLQRSEAVSFPPKTTPFTRWASLLSENARSAQVRNELDYWTRLSAKHVKPLPIDFRRGSNTEAEARALTIALDASETRALLRDVGHAYGTQINDVLLTALLDALSHWTSEQNILVELEGHGREDLFDDVDLSRTVGWFTNAFPVLLEATAGLSSVAALQSVKRQLRSIPAHGIGYGLLRYLNDDAEVSGQMRDLPEPEVSFNYLGQLDQ
ncbi:MAG TPA: condensation domain-containing protein, partial [Pyrinomonadaceae bacterium]|nr:condensation domain-containing protein [Pyrinomonadaceae bacterium]